MDTRDGRIFTEEEIEALRQALPHDHPDPFRPMKLPPTKRQLLRRPPRVGRNDLCPCGSGLKFKRCCLRKVEG